MLKGAWAFFVFLKAWNEGGDGFTAFIGCVVCCVSSFNPFVVSFNYSACQMEVLGVVMFGAMN